MLFDPDCNWCWTHHMRYAKISDIWGEKTIQKCFVIIGMSISIQFHEFNDTKCSLTVLLLNLNCGRCVSLKHALHDDQWRLQHYGPCGISSWAHHRWHETAANFSSTFSLHMIHLHRDICNRCAVNFSRARNFNEMKNKRIIYQIKVKRQY